MRFPPASVVGVLVWLIAGLAPAFQAPVFRAGVAVVHVDAAVIEDGRVVEGLGATDFVVKEDKRARPILHFASDSAPLDLVLLLDVSGSMRLHVEALARTAREALGPLRAGDRAAIAVFTDRLEIVQDLTADLDVVEAALNSRVRIVPDANTDVSRALLSVAGYIRNMRRNEGRRAVLLVTDNRVRRTIADRKLIAALLDADAVLNAIQVPVRFERFTMRGGRPEFEDVSRTAPDLARIAAATGGEVVSSNETAAAFARMVEQIRHRYSLYYRPRPGPGGKFRAIAVELSVEARRRFPRARVLARRGYVPASPTE